MRVCTVCICVPISVSVCALACVRACGHIGVRGDRSPIQIFSDVPHCVPWLSSELPLIPAAANSYGALLQDVQGTVTPKLRLSLRGKDSLWPLPMPGSSGGRVSGGPAPSAPRISSSLHRYPVLASGLRGCIRDVEAGAPGFQSQHQGESRPGRNVNTPSFSPPRRPAAPTLLWRPL